MPDIVHVRTGGSPGFGPTSTGSKVKISQKLHAPPARPKFPSKFEWKPSNPREHQGIRELPPHSHALPPPPQQRAAQHADTGKLVASFYTFKIMSGVNYSKWDKMASEMSDSEDEDGNQNPQVTTFDTPQSVTFGGAADSQSGPGQDDSGNHPDGLPPHSSIATSAEASSSATSTEARITDEQLSRNGAVIRREGGDQVGHVWRQTRDEVVVVIPAPRGTCAGDVKVSLRAKPETVAEGVADLMKVSLKRRRDDGANAQEGQVEEVLLEGELAFQAKLDEEGDVDWEVKDFPGTLVATRDMLAVHATSGENTTAVTLDGGATVKPEQGTTCAVTSERNSNESNTDRRGIEVTLRKHCPIPNAVVWWKSLLKGGPEIDVSGIQGRAKNNHQSVWEEALGMFKDKVAARKEKGRIPIDIGSGE